MLSSSPVLVLPVDVLDVVSSSGSHSMTPVVLPSPVLPDVLASLVLPSVVPLEVLVVSSATVVLPTVDVLRSVALVLPSTFAPPVLPVVSSLVVDVSGSQPGKDAPHASLVVVSSSAWT